MATALVDSRTRRVLVARRFVAASVDVVLAFGLALALGVALGRWLIPIDHEAVGVWLVAGALGLVAVALLPVLWFVAGESAFGATPGKALLGLRVLDESGGRLRARSALRRLLYRSALFGGLGVAGLLLDARPWHDRWAGAEVRPRRPIAPRRPENAPTDSPVPGTVLGDHPSAADPGPTTPVRERTAPDETAVAPRAQERRALVDQPPASPLPHRFVPGSPAVRGDAATARSRRPDAAGSRRSGDDADECRCHELRELTGDEAADYARGHLLTVRRWPDAGRFTLVCPVTRSTWLAHDAWAAEGQETTLVRLGEGIEAPSPAATAST
jgi:uncharacterized RDD family membrane protein YckC